MKPLMLVPPAQAEALYDAQLGSHRGSQREVPEGLRLESRSLDRLARLPWTDDDSAEENSQAAKHPKRYAA